MALRSHLPARFARQRGRSFRPVLIALLIFPATAGGCQWLAQGRNGRDEMVRQLAEQAERAEEQQDWTQAADFWNRAAERDPENAGVLHRSAASRLSSGDRTGARDRFLQAMNVPTDDPETLVKLAKLARRLDERQHEQRLLGRALRLDADNIDALALQAESLEAAGQSAEAIAIYHRILTLDRDHVSARLRVAHHQIESGHADRAAVLLRGICHCPLASDGTKSEARRQLAQAYSREGRWRDASAILQQVVDSQEVPAAVDLQQLAYAYERGGNLQDAANVRRSLTPLARGERQASLETPLPQR